MKASRWIAAVTLVLVAVGGLWFWLTGREAKPLAEGDRAPDFTLPGAFGGEGSLKDLRGRVVLLHFWATWSSPARRELASLQALRQRFPGDDFEVAAVALDVEGAPVVRDFVKDLGLQFPVIVDPEGKTGREYGLTALPETFILDKNGVIVKRIKGGRNWAAEEQVELIARLLGRQPRPAPAPATDSAIPLAPQQPAMKGGGKERSQ